MFSLKTYTDIYVYRFCASLDDLAEFNEFRNLRNSCRAELFFAPQISDSFIQKYSYFVSGSEN